MGMGREGVEGGERIEKGGRAGLGYLFMGPSC